MRLKALSLLSVILCAATAGAALAGEKAEPKPKEPPKGPSPAEVAAMAPGEPQKQLSRMVGDWTYVMRFWSAPGEPPSEARGTMHAVALMGGRYIEHSWHGDYLGEPYEGRGTNSYDNVARKYVSVWMDNMSTGITLTTATCDAAYKVYHYSGEELDPETGKRIATRSVLTWIDNDHFTNEMYGQDATGKEVKTGEMDIVRKKK